MADSKIWNLVVSDGVGGKKLLPQNPSLVTNGLIQSLDEESD